MGSNPATLLVLIALLAPLSGLYWVASKLKEVPMKKQHEKSENSKSMICMVKRRITKLAKPTAYIFETIWAIGAGMVAAMVSPLPIH